MKDLAGLEQRFLKLLDHHGGLGNATAKLLLGWDEGTYAMVKDSLVAKRLITVGRGRGGSVHLAADWQRRLALLAEADRTPGTTSA